MVLHPMVSVNGRKYQRAGVLTCDGTTVRICGCSDVQRSIRAWCLVLRLGAYDLAPARLSICASSQPSKMSRLKRH